MIWLRCDADKTLGFGHFSRCRILASALEERGFPCGFVISERSGKAVDLAREAGHKVHPLPHRVPIEVEAAHYPDIARLVVFDLCSHRTMRTPEALAKLVGAINARHVATVVIDGLGSEGYRLGNIAPPNLIVTPYLNDSPDEVRVCGTWLRGPEFAILPLSYEDLPPRPEPGARPRVLVTIGGADPWRLTERILAAILAGERDILCRVVLGPLFSEQRRRDMNALGRRCPEALECVVAPVDLLMEYRDCAAVIIGAGLSRYEAAAAETAMIIACPDESAYRNSLPFQAAGAALLAPSYAADFDDSLPKKLESLLENETLLAASRRAGRTLIDGHGTRRVLDAILGHL